MAEALGPVEAFVVHVARRLVDNPDAVPGVMNPPGTPSRRYHPED